MSCFSIPPLIILAEPKVLVFLLYPFYNLVMSISPVALGSRKAALALAFIFLPAGLMPLTLPQTLLGDVYIGFYLWVASFFIVTLGCIALALGDDARTDSPGHI